ncbi:hypothetical protein V8E36_000787, partial [Tilletia maclaganii]
MRWDLRQQPSSSVQLLPFESTGGPLAHPSEHPTIHVELCTEALSARQDPAHDTTRPNLARLRDQKTRSAFRAAYAARSPGIEAALTLAEERARDSRASPQNRQDAVDFADQLCHTELLDAAFASLGSYSAKNVRRKRDDEAARLEHEAANDTTAALRRWRRAQRGRARPLVSSEEGQAAGRTAEEDALWYWGGVWGSRMAAPTPPESVEECGIEDGEDGDSVALSEEFSEEAVIKAIRRYPKHKSGGEDGDHAVLLAALLPDDDVDDPVYDTTDQPALPLHLACLLRLVAGCAVTPLRWGRAMVHLLPKVKTGAPTAATSRPIGMLPMFRRLDPANDWAALHPGQAGFRRGWSCASALLFNHEAAHTRRHI